MGPIEIPKKVLLIKLRAMGDTVLLTAPLNELRKRLDGTEIHVAVRSAWAPLIENQPGVSKVWSYDRGESKTPRIRSLTRLAFYLRKERFDWVINFHASPSSALLALSTGASVRSIHFHGHHDKNQFSTVMVPGKGVLKPIIERDMDAVRALGFDIPSGSMPRLDLGSLRRSEPQGVTPASPLLVIGLGASRPAKSWPIPSFAKAAGEWIKRTGGDVIAVTSAPEIGLAKKFSESIDPVFRQKAQVRSDLSVRNLALLLSQASVFLGNDSGPKHLAVACGTPTVTCFGPEDPFEWHPYPRDIHPYFFIPGLSCRRDGLPGFPPWCGLETCTVEKHKCMERIRPDEVIEACIRVKRS